jgi:ABC-2 type transport system permease protein
MKQFLAFVRKEFYHIFRDKRTLVVLFGMPLAQLLLFGYAITTEVNNAKIGIYNQSPGQFSKQLVEKLTSSDFFSLAATPRSEKEMLAAFQTNKVKMVVVIPPNFERDFANGGTKVQLIADGSDPNLATILTSSAEAIIMGWMKGNVGQNLQIETINPQVRWHYNPTLKSAEMFVPGVVTIILMLVSAMLTSISITREKELGTIEILYVSPLKPAIIIIGKVLPFAILSMINAIFILIMAWVVFGVPVNGSVVLLLLEMLLFIFTALGLGVLISTIANDQQTALMLSLFALMLPTILLSGFIFPIANMPLPLRVISNIIPAKWFLIIIKNIMLKGVGLAYVWKETAILLGMTLFFIGVSVKKFKLRLQ